MRRQLVPTVSSMAGGSETAAGAEAISLLASIYKEWVPADRIITMSTWSSELSKLVSWE